MESGKNKTKQESYRIHLPSLCRSLPNGKCRRTGVCASARSSRANVNAHDNEGNTPLHETFLTDVEEELLKLGEDVNARNELMGMWRYEPAATSSNERLVRILSKNYFADHWALPIWVSSWL
jgi:hypothetical protein